jgi:hypothetical protein
VCDCLTWQAAGSQPADQHLGLDAAPTVTSSAELARLGLTRSHLHPCVLKVRMPKVSPEDKVLGSHRLTTISDLSRACRASPAQLLALSNDELHHLMREAEADGHLIGILGRRQILDDAAVLRDIDTQARLVLGDIAASKIQAVWRGRMVRHAQRVASLPGAVNDT